ncbi:MAG TPA: glycosyltransferase [Candidatus Eisenbacteria bacterium]|nr:glycosyltransferase [Candidatus Eisenbacteria bacterium]
MAVATRAGSGPDPTTPFRFSVVVPTRGRDDLLETLIATLTIQVFPRERWEWIVAFDGVAPSEEIAARLKEAGAAIVVAPERAGPGAARNLGARRARGDYLAFTEDDCIPAPGWLAAAAERLEREPALDALEGATLLPDGRPARRRHGDRPTWLPTNLFVRRARFEQVGGYCERFFDARGGIYFREDSDFGFTLREAGVRAAYEPDARVTHPPEHQGWLDPLRWARRYEMDPLLASRHPEAFREEIEVVRAGPFRIRRPFVRASAGYVLALLSVGAAAAIGEMGVASWFAALAALMVLLLWSKWRFDPRKLPAVLVVPPILLAALARGRMRLRDAGASTVRSATSSPDR